MLLASAQHQWNDPKGHKSYSRIEPTQYLVVYYGGADLILWIESMSSRYQQNGANCMRLARETNDAVLSFGYVKMAQAWLELEKSRRRNPRRRALSKHTRSRGMNRRRHLSSRRTLKRKTAFKPPNRRVRSSV